MSPGWQSSALQMAESVENRTPLTLTLSTSIQEGKSVRQLTP